MLTPEETAAAELAKQTEADAQAKAEADAKAKEEAEQKNDKVGDLLKTEQPKKETRMVPESALLEFKNENKELKRSLTDLQKKIEDGATRKEVALDLEGLAKKHDVKLEFLQDFANLVRSQTEAEMETKMDDKIKPLSKKERDAEVDTIFNDHYSKTLEAMPEFKGVANKDVIKALALDPKNANKTFAQLLESAYGHLVTGKKTIEKTKPRGGKGDAGIDFDKARKDPEYFKEIMADPDLKKQYNEGLSKRLQSVL